MNTIELLEKLPNIQDCPDLTGKRVLLRTSLNVPIKDGSVVNQFRIKKALPTIEFLRSEGAKVVIIAHLSHVGEKIAGTLKPVYDALHDHTPAAWADDVIGPEIEKKIEAMDEGDVLMLENLRMYDGEKENDDTFAKELAALADIYVNDAFAASHREHASIVGVPKYLPAYAGHQLIEEITELSRARTPEHPALFILGGAKFDTKMPLVEELIDTYDRIFIGGALSNDFFRAKGYEVGNSLTSNVDLRNSFLMDHPKIMLPIDIVARSDRGTEVKKPSDVAADETILDAGPETIEMLSEEIRFVKTVLWNGPLGDYEQGFGSQTEHIASVIAESDGTSIVGGGDTIAAIDTLDVVDQFDFISIGGGAMLAFLEYNTLPGIQALIKE